MSSPLQQEHLGLPSFYISGFAHVTEHQRYRVWRQSLLKTTTKTTYRCFCGHKLFFFFLFVFLTLIMPGFITNNFVRYFGMRSLLGVSLHLKNHNSVITEGV